LVGYSASGETGFHHQAEERPQADADGRASHGEGDPDPAMQASRRDAVEECADIELSR